MWTNRTSGTSHVAASLSALNSNANVHGPFALKQTVSLPSAADLAPCFVCPLCLFGVLTPVSSFDFNLDEAKMAVPVSRRNKMEPDGW